MSVLSSRLRALEGQRVAYWCPGCNRAHILFVGHGGEPPRWMWNGDAELPTFMPSVLVTWDEPSDIPEEFDDRTKDLKRVCHSWVKAGVIEFLSDCTHALVSQHVPIPPWPEGGSPY